jgi:hypothetical protein
MLMFQLTSWDPYVDWERAHTIPIYLKKYLKKLQGRVDEGGYGLVDPEYTPHFPHFASGIQVYDEQMRRLEYSNPETFRVERRSQWATALNAYLIEARVDAIFAPYLGEQLQPQASGSLGTDYLAHGDPSKSGANFAFGIAHREQAGRFGVSPRHLRPVDRVDPRRLRREQLRDRLISVGHEISDYMDDFMPIGVELRPVQLDHHHPDPAQARP